MAKYRQPSGLNLVSVTLLLVLAAVGYAGYAAWPVIALDAGVKSVIEDALPRLYRANLLPEPEATLGAEQVRQSVAEELTRLGIDDAAAALSMSRDTERVVLAVTLHRVIELTPIHQRIPITLTPRVTTSAARVSY